MRSFTSQSKRAIIRFQSPIAGAIGLAVFVCLHLLSLPPSALAQQMPYATITKVEGTVMVRSQVSPSTGEWRQVTELNHPLFKGDEIKTDTGAAEITYADDESFIILEEKTEISLHEGSKHRKILGIPTDRYISRTIKVVRGKLSADIKERKDLVTEFESPTVLAAVRGTKLYFFVDPTTGEVTVTSESGLLEVIPLDGSALINLSDGTVKVSVDPDTGAVSVDSLQGDHEVQTETGVIVSIEEGGGASMIIDPESNSTYLVSTGGEITAYVGPNIVILEEGESFQAYANPATGTVDIIAMSGEIEVNGKTLPEGEMLAGLGFQPPPAPPPEAIPPSILDVDDASPSS